MNFLLKYGLKAVALTALTAGACYALKALAKSTKTPSDLPGTQSPEPEVVIQPETTTTDKPTQETMDESEAASKDNPSLETVDELETLLEKLQETVGELETAYGSPLVKEAPRFVKPDDSSLRTLLTPEQYAITQQNGTEPPFHNAYYDCYKPGIYVDLLTGEPLFSSLDKFESGCGWPAFSRPLNSAAVIQQTDRSHGMNRTEVRSRQGDCHLGHVFSDGPIDRGGLRYCINSAALRFIPKEEMVVEGYGDWLSLWDA